MRMFLALLALCFASAATAQTPAHTMPAWFVAHVEFISRDGGTWRAPNPAGENDPNQPDAFGMEWRAAYGGHVLIGRLYGIENGQEIAEYWTFREFWHPGERRVIIEQWGGPGAYGVGETFSAERVEQTFWLPDGRSWREGHRNQENGDTYVTASFDIQEDGAWTPNGTYTWTRVRAE
ncbi:MAG: hypothetical protein AB7J28_10245 [Hyphomonadaceae bacterium]